MSDLAKVGDRIEHGQDIPANVVLVRDEDNDLWERGKDGTFRCRTDSTGQAIEQLRGCWPLKVVEVDPEQPAERKLIGPPHAHQDAPCTDACYEPADDMPDGHDLTPRQDCGAEHAHGGHRWKARIGWRLCPGFVGRAGVPQPTTPGPLVLTLPVVPDGAVALLGNASGRRYSLALINGSLWTDDTSGKEYGYVDVLKREQPNGVTVEMAPPREPRVWPKLEGAPENEASVRGSSGVVYDYLRSEEFIPVYQAKSSTGAKGRPYSFYVLQVLDGPLTEVVEHA